MAGYTDILAVRTHSAVFLAVVKEDNCHTLDNEGNSCGFFQLGCSLFSPATEPRLCRW